MRPSQTEADRIPRLTGLLNSMFHSRSRHCIPRGLLRPQDGYFNLMAQQIDARRTGFSAIWPEDDVASRGLAFTGAKRKRLTEESGCLGADFGKKGKTE